MIYRKILFHISLQISLGWTLENIHQDYLSPPLKNFKMTLPLDWGMPLGWSLSFIPILIIIGGILFHFTWKKRGIPFKMVSLFLESRQADSSVKIVVIYVQNPLCI